MKEEEEKKRVFLENAKILKWNFKGQDGLFQSLKESFAFVHTKHGKWDTIWVEKPLLNTFNLITVPFTVLSWDGNIIVYLFVHRRIFIHYI